MTELQRHLWNQSGARFIELMAEQEIGEEITLKALFGDEWEAIGDGVQRQAFGRAVSVAFASPEFIDQLDVVQQTEVDGSPNRMQYRRTR